MKIVKIILLVTCLFLITYQLKAQSTSPVVSNVRFQQRLDNSFKVDIYYDVASPLGYLLNIKVEASSDAGLTWTFPITKATGDVGPGITAGTGKHIVWDFGTEFYNFFGTKVKIQITADDGIEEYTRCPGIPTVTFAGKTYNTVQIGTQCWLKENMDAGTMISGKTEQANNRIIEKYCYDDNDSNCAKYGGLYQWAEAMQYQDGATNTNSPNPAFYGSVQGICPPGWHIPTSAEFQTLSSYAGGDGNMLKALGQGYGRGEGTNTTHFSALLAGTRTSSGYFNNSNGLGYFWMATEGNTPSTDAIVNVLYNVDTWIFTGSGTKISGYSVRCLKGDGMVPMPVAPILYSPYKNSTNLSIDPTTLKWKKPARAVSYNFQIALDSLFTNIVVDGTCNDTVGGTRGLSYQTKYYWRVSASNSYGTSPFSEVWSFTTKVDPIQPCPDVPTVTYAGKTYHTVQIGTQCWMKENLDVGTKISSGTDQLNNGLIEKYCYNDSVSNCDKYGGLYQWAEVIQYQNGATNTTAPNPALTGKIRGICPQGWHIPSDSEFHTLSSAVSNNSNALKLKGEGTGTGAGTNTSGFSALLGGYNIFGTSAGYYAYLWSAKDYGTRYAYILSINKSDTTINIPTSLKYFGYNVRCIKD